MAVELKMMGRCLNSAVARFAVRHRFVKNSPDNVIPQCRYISNYHKSITQSKHFIKWPSYCVHPFDCTSHDKTKQSSNDVIQLSKYLRKCPSNFISPQNVATPIQTNSNDLFFRQFDSKYLESPYLLHVDKNTLEYLKGLPKSFFFRRRKSDDKKPQRRIPKLILIQNPFTWLMIKIDFSVLRNVWDPSFTENEFKFGTKQAISKVTNVISAGQFSDLNGLLTKAARSSLMRELDRNWSDKQRSLLALKHEDIQISSPRKVYFIRIADKKYCDVDMAFLALKWAPINSVEALIFTEIFARFHREYTPHSIPEWTIAYFKVTRFEVLRKKPRLT